MVLGIDYRRHLQGLGVNAMIGQIVSAIGGLATSYIDGKTAIQKANAEIKLKQATGEINWEQSAIEASKTAGRMSFGRLCLLLCCSLILFRAYKTICEPDLPIWRNVRSGYSGAVTRPLLPPLE